MESIKESLTEMMETFNQRMTDFEADLSKASSCNPSSTSSLAAEFMTFRAFTQKALSSLQQQMELIARSVDAMEMRGRRNILLVHGVEEQSEEDIVQVLSSIVKDRFKINDFSSTAIKRCHRMGQPAASRKPRPILVKFNQSAIRDEIWFAKTTLKGSGITVSEFLTKSRHDVFMAARDRFGISKCWTREGFIFVLGPDDVRYRILTMSELNDIQQVTIKEATAVKTTTKRTRRAAAIKK